jgi:hypothetical protein
MQNFSNNKKSFIVSDVHGCGKELKDLINLLDYPEEYEFFSLGDNFDRAFEGVSVWETLHQYRFRCIMGNHENKIKNFLDKKITSVPKHYAYFIKEFTKKYPISLLRNFVNELPCLISHKGNILVHAGVDVDMPFLENFSLNVYGTRGKKRWQDEYKNNNLVIYGHESVHDCIIENNTVCIDTGACHGRKLTGLILDEDGNFEKILQIQSNDYFSTMKNLAIPLSKLDECQ